MKRQKAQELKQKWTEKKIYGKFIREMPENVDKDKTWNRLVRSDLKRRESAQHTISECEKLAQKEYKRRHDNCSK